MKRSILFSQISITEYNNCTIYQSEIRIVLIYLLLYFNTIRELSRLRKDLFVEWKLIPSIRRKDWNKYKNINTIITSISVYNLVLLSPRLMERSVYPVYIARCTFLPGTNQVLVINQLSLSFPDILPSISGVQSGNRSPPDRGLSRPWNEPTNCNDKEHRWPTGVIKRVNGNRSTWRNWIAQSRIKDGGVRFVSFFFFEKIWKKNRDNYRIWNQYIVSKCG